MKPKKKLVHWVFATERIVAIIQGAENRCMACDGPVGLTSKEITEKELKEIYRLACDCRATAQVSGSEGAQLIANERGRQLTKEGWTAQHDDDHDNGELALAAACYAVPPKVRFQSVFNKTLIQHLWPWEARWWNPTGRIRDLTKAGALIAAEIDRLLRLEKRKAK